MAFGRSASNVASNAIVAAQTVPAVDAIVTAVTWPVMVRVVRRRSAEAIAERASRKAERQAAKAEIAAIQIIIDSISGATTLGDLRGYIKDLAKTLKRVTRLVT